MQDSIKISKTDKIQDKNYWIEEKLTLKNLKEFLLFLKEEYPEHEENLTIIRKKMMRFNKSTLSTLILFSREIDKSKDFELEIFIKNLIQIIMDNPKKFRR